MDSHLRVGRAVLSPEPRALVAGKRLWATRLYESPNGRRRRIPRDRKSSLYGTITVLSRDVDDNFLKVMTDLEVLSISWD